MTRRSEMWPRYLLALPLVLAACAPAGERPPDDHHAAAVARIVSDLRSEVAVVGRAAPPSYALEARMAELEVPGVSVAVVEDGRIAWARGFGVREAATADSVSATTLFQAASISKPIAATAILRLVEQGKLELDVPVNEYLTSWKLPENDLTAGHPVTLRHLVSHGAGTTVWGFPGYRAGSDLPSVPQILDGLPPANTSPVRADLVPATAGGIPVEGSRSPSSRSPT